MTKKEKREKAIFEYFEKKNPDFAGRKVTPVAGNDPPDILCTDEAGKRIGVELGRFSFAIRNPGREMRPSSRRRWGSYTRRMSQINPRPAPIVLSREHETRYKKDSVGRPVDRASTYLPQDL